MDELTTLLNHGADFSSIHMKIKELEKRMNDMKIVLRKISNKLDRISEYILKKRGSDNG